VDQNEIIKVIYPKMTPFTSQQARWDGWARLVQPLFATTPTLALGGDHELEPVPNVSGVAMVAFNARYPQPQDPASINTAPNNPATYLNASNANQFALDEGAVTPNNSFWSVALPPVHIISFNPYLPWGPGSKQRRWFDAAVAAVDRARTPWLLVATHGARTKKKNSGKSDEYFFPNPNRNPPRAQCPRITPTPNTFARATPGSPPGGRPPSAPPASTP
jgi:hypothetical protein